MSLLFRLSFFNVVHPCVFVCLFMFVLVLSLFFSHETQQRVPPPHNKLLYAQRLMHPLFIVVGERKCFLSLDAKIDDDSLVREGFFFCSFSFFERKRKKEGFFLSVENKKKGAQTIWIVPIFIICLGDNPTNPNLQNRA
uniref:Uncharacterized protein n=1 Tax=Palpitomonas bilix TaxID=652834 RepID=A0A7S3D7K9_9EUKA|mmetsp:Transcript_25818/g.65221  ORF Transcript_25818/g.65221 Transcript_25818/m.65221 type:complete len:139 (+) Transcript_25818:3-419(+)